MKKLMIILAVLLNGCTSYSTSLHRDADIASLNKQTLRKARVCSNNLFGGFKLPYVGDTAIRISGTQSITDAIVKGNITHVYSTDTSKKSYIFFTRKCTIVYGKGPAKQVYKFIIKRK